MIKLEKKIIIIIVSRQKNKNKKSNRLKFFVFEKLLRDVYLIRDNQKEISRLKFFFFFLIYNLDDNRGLKQSD